MSIVLDGTSGVVVSGNTNTLSGITVGRGAGSVATNTAVGASALAANSSGARITAVGYTAGTLATAGNSVFVGSYAGQANTTGAYNSVVGDAALYGNTTGNISTVYTSDAKYLYKPSTGELQSSVLNASNGIVVNSQTVSASYTIPTGSSAMSSGPITIASGQSVTVSSGSRWVVL